MSAQLVISPQIELMIRRSTDRCPLCNHLVASCVCKTDEPLAEGSTVLRFMQSPTDADHRGAILHQITNHIYDWLCTEIHMGPVDGLTAALALIRDLDLNLSIGGTLATLSHRVQLDPNNGIGFDYDNQAWVQDGKYIRCGHPEMTPCDCFGRLHAGENVRA